MSTVSLFVNEAIAMLQKVTEMEVEELTKLLETPPSVEMGDLAFPCFVLAKSWRRAPQQIAAELCSRIREQPAYAHIHVTAAGAYVNMHWDRTISSTALLERIADQQHYQLQVGGGQRIIIDMSSPNIAKPFGVGHLRSTVIGAALYRMYRAAGYEALRVNHIGDWGTQFGKQITAHLRWSDPVQMEQNPIGEALRVYIKFHDEAAEHPELEDEARDWFRKLESGDPQALELWRYFVDVSMASLDRMYERLGVEFDAVLGESFYNDKMPAVVDRLRELDLLEESDGALVVRLDEQDMPPCLIIKSDGTTIYPTRDLATAIYRKEMMHGDRLVYVVGGEQALHFRQVFAVLRKMGYNWAEDCIHVPFGLMKVNGKKMSTRKGKVVFLEEVLDEAVQQAARIIEEKNPSLPDKQEVARQVGVGAIIFNDLKNNRQNGIDFSLEEAVSFEGETGPYVQYAYARIQSILRRVEQNNESAEQPTGEEVAQQSASEAVEPSDSSAAVEEPSGWTDTAWELLCHLAGYDSELERAVRLHEPSIMARYALQTARLFNQFYSHNRILDCPPAWREQRLQLSRQTGEYLARLMELLGMQAPQQM
ncbi:arginine--tRNA ligase [Paenibacillus sp. Z6-24]